MYPRKQKYFFGKIWVDEKLSRWIANHRGFASIVWFKGQVKWGRWVNYKNNNFEIYSDLPFGAESIRVRIRCTYYPNGGPHFPDTRYVHVWGAHTVRSK